MTTVFYAILLAVVWLAAACGAPPRVETSVGALCKKSSDCYNTTKAQVCASNPESAPKDQQSLICTRECVDRTGCPQGYECIYHHDLKKKLCLSCQDNYDCGVGTFCQPSTAPAGTTCNPVPPKTAPAGCITPARTCQAASVPQGDFGKDCAIQGDAACNTGQGFFCHSEIQDDPESYCTKTCLSDADCYINMYCGTPTADNVPSSKKKRCFLKTQCSSCRDDSECAVPNSVNTLCVTDDRGRGFCTRPCDMNSSMPCTAQGADHGYLACITVAKQGKPGQMVDACVPRYGAPTDDTGTMTGSGHCYDAGIVCDPCRPHTPEDCQSPQHCVTNPNTGENLCLMTCKTSDDCGMNPNLGADTTLRCIQVTQTDKGCTASSSALTCWP